MVEVCPAVEHCRGHICGKYLGTWLGRGIGSKVGQSARVSYVGPVGEVKRVGSPINFASILHNILVQQVQEVLEV